MLSKVLMVLLVGMATLRDRGKNIPPITPNVGATSEKRRATSSPKGKKKKTFKDQCMKRLVDVYEKKTESSNNSTTSKVVDIVREEIGNMLDQVIKDGAKKGSNEHYYATQLFIKKEYHASDVFMSYL
jgi:DNA-directed RNA polymerase